ncbi:MAG: hypothetical protein ACXVH3_25700 [Solirubrobacteraceae bacterium]
MILGAAISPHQVQFHVHVTGAAAVGEDEGAMGAAGFGFGIALAGAAAELADDALGLGSACATGVAVTAGSP